MSGIRIEVDTGGVLERAFTDLERRQLPFVAMTTANKVADEVKFRWAQLLRRRLDNPVKLTQGAAMVRRARYQGGASGQRKAQGAEVFIRDEAAKGTPPARYLFPQVFGGAGHDRGIDRGLRRAGILGMAEFAIPVADSTLTDANGNVKNGVVQQILSQMGAQFDSLANETATSRARNDARGSRNAMLKRKNRRFFAVTERNRTGGSRHLSPGIYWRDGRVDLTKVYHFTKRPSQYRSRLDLFGSAQKAFNVVFPFHFNRELAKALETSKFRGRS